MWRGSPGTAPPRLDPRHSYFSSSAMEINQQPSERYLPGQALEVHSLWPTIQGEGPLAGSPSVFVRLSGCNLQCPFCDTEYTSIRRSLYPLELIEEISKIRKSGLIVVTGGEPFRQAALGRFCCEALSAGYKVQIETNGTMYQDDLPYGSEDLVIVCSPKAPSINSALQQHIHALKYILQAGKVEEQDGLPRSSMGSPMAIARPRYDSKAEIYVQPLDEQDEEANKRNLDTAVSVCMKFGYKLCVQIHKIIGMP